MILQYHSCAVSRGGAVSCWGYNGYGQVMFLQCFVQFDKSVKDRAFVFVLADVVCVCAAWRRLHGSAKHARGCCWFEQRRNHGCFRRRKIISAADSCMRAGTVCLTDWVLDGDVEA